MRGPGGPNMTDIPENNPGGQGAGDTQPGRDGAGRVTMAHGSGGEATSRLIGGIIAKYFSNPYLDRMEDAAVVPGNEQLALTTDSFVVDPPFYPGGSIGRLCVCGTVNDLLMSGARPQYLTCGMILEEGFALDRLDAIARDIAETAREAGVLVVAGDTKVIENGAHPEGGVLINTAGVGFVPEGRSFSPALIRPGDAVILSGTLGEHHAAILGARMGIDNRIVSDNAPLTEMVGSLIEAGIHIRAMRDVTRGGLATVLCEFADQSGLRIVLEQGRIPVRREVRDFCGILGLDPLYMGNEGKMVLVAAAEDAKRAAEIIRTSRYGRDACVIGAVGDVPEGGSPGLLMETAIGGTRVLGPLYGEGLPRIC